LFPSIHVVAPADPAKKAPAKKAPAKKAPAKNGQRQEMATNIERQRQTLTCPDFA